MLPRPCRLVLAVDSRELASRLKSDSRPFVGLQRMIFAIGRQWPSAQEIGACQPKSAVSLPHCKPVTRLTSPPLCKFRSPPFAPIHQGFSILILGPAT